MHDLLELYEVEMILCNGPTLVLRLSRKVHELRSDLSAPRYLQLAR